MGVTLEVTPIDERAEPPSPRRLLLLISSFWIPVTRRFYILFRFFFSASAPSSDSPLSLIRLALVDPPHSRSFSSPFPLFFSRILYLTCWSETVDVWYSIKIKSSTSIFPHVANLFSIHWLLHKSCRHQHHLWKAVLQVTNVSFNYFMLEVPDIRDISVYGTKKRFKIHYFREDALDPSILLAPYHFVLPPTVTKKTPGPMHRTSRS